MSTTQIWCLLGLFIIGAQAFPEAAGTLCVIILFGGLIAGACGVFG